jgi:hypothetical protein
VLGVAAAVAVLAGALLVGDSVRASLRDLVVQRLGNTDYVITSQGFFREQLASDIQSDPQFAAGALTATCPLIASEGTITHEPSKRVGSRVRVYGVDDRFWRFNGALGKQPPQNREAFISEALSRELGANAGDSLILRVQKPSDIPIESLHSKKEDLGSTLRLTVKETLAADALGEFAIQPQQGAVRAIFIPLKSLQKEIAQEGKINLVLVSEAPKPSESTSQSAVDDQLGRILKTRASLEDFGIKLRTVGEPPGISLEHDSRMINESLAKIASESARALSLKATPVFSYLANSIKTPEHAIPYSLVTALDVDSFEELRKSAGEKLEFREGTITYLPATFTDPQEIEELRRTSTNSGLPPIILNQWAARDLGVHLGDPVSLEYYLWHEGGSLETKTAQFQLIAVVPIAGLAADRDLVPEYPGITGSENLSDWDPPFPVDLKRVRKQDEDYWHQYRTTPKAFIPLAAGQELWQSRFGNLTSIRLVPGADRSLNSTLEAYRQKLIGALDPVAMGFAVIPARAQGLAASRGATDFGEYFLYFSFFLVISALLLAALFFKLGIEQRLREIGTLQALGFTAARIRRLFLVEGLILAVIGSMIGLAGALAYGELFILWFS